MESIIQQLRTTPRVPQVGLKWKYYSILLRIIVRWMLTKYQLQPFQNWKSEYGRGWRESLSLSDTLLTPPTPPPPISVVVWHDKHNCSWWFCYYSVVCLSCCCFCCLCQFFDIVFVFSRGSDRTIYINDWVKWAWASLNEIGHGWVVRWKVRLDFHSCCTIQPHFQSHDLLWPGSVRMIPCWCRTQSHFQSQLPWWLSSWILFRMVHVCTVLCPQPMTLSPCWTFQPQTMIQTPQRPGAAPMYLWRNSDMLFPT